MTKERSQILSRMILVKRKRKAASLQLVRKSKSFSQERTKERQVLYVLLFTFRIHFFLVIFVMDDFDSVRGMKSEREILILVLGSPNSTSLTLDGLSRQRNQFFVANGATSGHSSLQPAAAVFISSSSVFLGSLSS